MYIIVNVCVCVARGGGIKLSYETGSTTRLNLKTFLYWVIQLGERGLEFFMWKIASNDILVVLLVLLL